MTIGDTETLLDHYRTINSDKPIIDDCHEAVVTNPAITTVDHACQAFFATSPAWLGALMRFRNKVVALFGFHTGDMTEPHVPEVIEVGSSFGVFDVLDRTDTEILLGGDDDHFSMRISLQLVDDRGERTVSLSTVAHHHDTLGRAYLSLVKYPHGPIAGMCAKRIATVVPK